MFSREALNNNKAILCASLYEVASHAKKSVNSPIINIVSFNNACHSNGQCYSFPGSYYLDDPCTSLVVPFSLDFIFCASRPREVQDKYFLLLLFQPDYDYKAAVKAALPQLRYLDDEPTLTLEARCEKKNASVFDEDWKLLQELMDEGTVISGEETGQIYTPCGQWLN